MIELLNCEVDNGPKWFEVRYNAAAFRGLFVLVWLRWYISGVGSAIVNDLNFVWVTATGRIAIEEDYRYASASSFVRRLRARNTCWSRTVPAVDSNGFLFGSSGWLTVLPDWFVSYNCDAAFFGDEIVFACIEFDICLEWMISWAFIIRFRALNSLS